VCRGSRSPTNAVKRGLQPGDCTGTRAPRPGCRARSPACRSTRIAPFATQDGKQQAEDPHHRDRSSVLKERAQLASHDNECPRQNGERPDLIPHRERSSRCRRTLPARCGRLRRPRSHRRRRPPSDERSPVGTGRSFVRNSMTPSLKVHVRLREIFEHGFVLLQGFHKRIRY